MKIKYALVALTLSTIVAAPAFAWNFDPCPTCDTATAKVTPDQTLVGLDVDNDDVTTNTAKIKDHGLQDAKGNIMVNMADGDANQQSNSVAIAVSDGEFCFGRLGKAEAAVYADQFSMKNDVHNDGTQNTVVLKDKALQNVCGNLGLNMAAGSGNQQNNNLAIALGKGVAVAKASADQESYCNDADNDDGKLWCWNVATVNTTTLENNALQNAAGNIGVNMAAGSLNQQSNSLSVAVALK